MHALLRRSPPLRIPLRRPPLRATLACAGALALLALGWLWLRDSGLVGVRHVEVTGLSGPQAQRIAAALEDAARDMTTLHVRESQLRDVVAQYPAVKGVEAQADFPHRLRIAVHERDAVGAVFAAGRRIAVAADGTLLRGTPARGLPAVRTRTLPAGERIADDRTRAAVALLAAAPPALRARVERVFTGRRGLTAPLRDGPDLVFGGSERLAAKWLAAASVLADAGTRGATYLDLRVPERPAAGGLEDPTPEPAITAPTPQEAAAATGP